MKTHNASDSILLFFGFVIFALVFVVMPIGAISQWLGIGRQREEVSTEANRTLRLNRENEIEWGDNPSEMQDINPGNIKQDKWGNDLRYRGLINQDVIFTRVSSDGKDGEPDTKDDIVEERSDINKSRLVGKWLGRKSKEAVGGIIDGLKEKSPFSEAKKKIKQLQENESEKLKWIPSAEQ